MFQREMETSELQETKVEVDQLEQGNGDKSERAQRREMARKERKKEKRRVQARPARR